MFGERDQLTPNALWRIAPVAGHMLQGRDLHCLDHRRSENNQVQGELDNKRPLAISFSSTDP